MKIAFLHYSFCGVQQNINTQKILAGMNLAAQHDANWVITPEMAVQGYHMMRNDFPFQLISQNNGLLYPFSKAAKLYKQRLFLGCGCVVDKVPHNSCIVLNQDGSYFNQHNKVKVVNWITENWAHPGEKFAVWDLDNIKTSVMVCADAYFKEHGESIAADDAQLVIVIAAWPPGGHSGPPEDSWMRLSSSANNIPVLVCNQTGNASMDFRQAQSAVISNGQVLFSYTGDEALLLMEFDEKTKQISSKKFEVIKIN